MTPRSEKNNQPSTIQNLLNNRITSPDKDSSISTLNSPRILTQQEKNQQEQPNSRTILKELYFAISNLQKKESQNLMNWKSHVRNLKMRKLFYFSKVRKLN